MGVRVRDLGPLVAEVDGREAAVKGVKLTAILSMLALHANERVSRDSLIDGVWGPTAGLERLPTLESHVWRLRRILEPCRRRGEPAQVLVNDTSGYRLVALSDQIDSARFTKLSEQTRVLAATGEADGVISAADTALGLWRGTAYELIADYAAAAPMIARLVETRRQVAARRVDALLDSGDAGRALSDVDDLLRAAPFDEHLWAARMLALHRLGRSADALHTFHQARSALRDEVGIDPGAKLVSLQRRILDNDATLVPAATSVRSAQPPPLAASSLPPSVPPSPGPGPSTPTANLPVVLTPLLGRAGVVDHLTALLRRHALVTVTGAAGCGKTRLAVEVARRAAGGYRDGTWFIDLTAIHAPSLVADVVLSTVGIAPGVTGTAVDGLRSYCQDRSVLLVLDNCEHVLAAATAVAQAVAGGSAHSAVLATSREPLDVAGEVLWTLGRLALPDVTAGRGARTIESPAIALFVDRMQAAHPDHTPTAAETALVVDICVALEGIPLAIELAAARLRSATLAEIAGEVARDPSSLRRPGRSGSGDGSTVRGNIEAGHRLLSAAEKAMHRRLAVLPGAFTRSAAAAVTAGAPLDAAEADYLLDSLVHRSLLMPTLDEYGASTLFRQLATVRGHAQHALRTAGELSDTEVRRDDWVAQFIARRPRIAHRDDLGWYPEAVSSLPTIRATLQRLVVDTPGRPGRELVCRLGMLWYFRGRMAEGQRWTELADTGGNSNDAVTLALHVAIAAADAVRDRTDLALPRIRGVLTELGELSLNHAEPAELVELGDLYAPLTIALGRAGPADLVSALARSAATLADAAGDTGLAVLSDTLAVSAGAASADPRATLERSDALFTRSLEVGHLFAALVAGGVGISLALSTRDPRGRQWAQRNYDVHRSQGGTQDGLLLETSANFAAFAAEFDTAIGLFAASQARAGRAGTTWPRHPITRTTLAGLQREMPADDFTRAWRGGRTLGTLTSGPRHS